MNSWAPLWSGLVDSSIWEEDDHVFRVFMAMMSLKDSNHTVTMDGYKLSRRIHMDMSLVEDALKTLSSPDKKRPGQPHDGRRIKPIEGGWLILNGEYYRKMVREEMRRARNRRAQQAYRDRNKPTATAGDPNGALVREFIRAESEGDTAAANAAVNASLPQPKPDDETLFNP